MYLSCPHESNFFVHIFSAEPPHLPPTPTQYLRWTGVQRAYESCFYAYILNIYLYTYFGHNFPKRRRYSVLFIPVPEIIDPVFAKTSQNARFLLSENERFGLVFVKSGSINSGTGEYLNQNHVIFPQSMWHLSVSETYILYSINEYG
jgi:hypothetical protein